MKNDSPIRVKVEAESNDIDVLQYDRAIEPNATVNQSQNIKNDRLISELSDLRRKYSEAIFQLQKSMELTVSLNEEKKELIQKIERANQMVGSLTAQKETLNLRMNMAEENMHALQHEKKEWKEQKIRLELSVRSFEKDKLASLENLNAKDKEIRQLHKELKTLQARMKQNQAAVGQNTRYFKRNLDQSDHNNNYEVKKLLTHRNKKSKCEFLVQWKDTWEPESSLNCPKMLSAYWRQHK